MKTFTIIPFFLVLITAFIYPQNINGRFSSSLYAFERFDTVAVGNTYTRAYQLLSLNINKDKFALRTYMNLETDLTKDIQDDPRLRFYNLYFEARDIFEIATLKLGRQPLFHSVASGIFDGVNLDLRYSTFRLTGYYGANTPGYQKLNVSDDWSNDLIFGTRLTAAFEEGFRFSAGYINKNFRPQEYNATRLDVDLNPIQVLIRNNSNQYRLITAEAGYELKNFFSLDTKYEYDLNFETSSRFEVIGNYNQLNDFNFNLYYNYREPLIRHNSIFSVFDFGNTWEIEGGVDYKFNRYITGLAKYGNVNYRDGITSQRLTAGVNTSFGSLIYRKTLGDAGELDAFSLYTAHSFVDGLLTPSVGLSFTNYKLSADAPVNELLSLLAGLNVRPWRELSFDVQGQFLNNKIYKNDLRLFLKVNYWFNTNLNLF